MTQAVMQIGQRWPQGNGGTVFFDGLSVISSRRFKVAHQLVQAIRICVRLIEPKISRGCQLFIAARAPIGRLSGVLIRCRQPLKTLESSFILSGIQRCACQSNAKFSGGPRSEDLPYAWRDCRELSALESDVDVCFGATPDGNLLLGGRSCKASFRRRLRQVPVLFDKKRKSEVCR